MERVMEDVREDLIDLGSVTEETKGALGGTNDSLGQRAHTGLTDD
jgi:hypothetical protein